MSALVELGEEAGPLDMIDKELAREAPEKHAAQKSKR
jgi:hypothetical protein